MNKETRFQREYVKYCDEKKCEEKREKAERERDSLEEKVGTVDWKSTNQRGN